MCGESDYPVLYIHSIYKCIEKMDELKNICDAIAAILLWFVVLLGCLVIWVIIPVALAFSAVVLLIFLLDVLGPVMGILTALMLAIIIGVIIQQFT